MGESVVNAGVIGGIIAVTLILAKVIQHLVFAKGERKDADAQRQRTSSNGSDIASLRKDLEVLKECARDQEELIRSFGINMVQLQEQSKRSQEQLTGLIGVVADLASMLRVWLAEERGRREGIRERGDTGQFRIPTSG